MGCGCNDPIRDWDDLENHDPRNPFEVIAYAEFAGVQGTFERSADFLGANASTTPLSYADGGVVEAWESDNLQMVADAQMWTMQHRMVNVSTSVPPALHKLAFLRGGIAWRCTLLVNVGVDLDYALLSFLENAGTRGDAQGTVPVLRFDGPILSGQHPLIVTLKRTGSMSIGMKTLATGSGDEAMMEMDWNVVR